MPKFNVAYSGWKVIEIEATDKQAAKDKFWADGLNDLYDAVVEEVVPVEEEFKQHTDLN